MDDVIILIICAIVWVIFCLFITYRDNITFTENKPINRKSYYRNTYLKSDHWRNTRNNALARSNFICQRCGAHQRLQVHHLSYKNIGHELDNELVVLCRDCHKKAHHIR